MFDRHGGTVAFDGLGEVCKGATGGEVSGVLAEIGFPVHDGRVRVRGDLVVHDGHAAADLKSDVVAAVGGAEADSEVGVSGLVRVELHPQSRDQVLGRNRVEDVAGLELIGL